MKQMTKEELIEYFIDQLGDNEVLGQVMNKEQIRQKLEYIIKDVTYDDEIGDYCGHWIMDEEGRGKVNFDNKKILANQENVVIVHELLHALTTTRVTIQDRNLIKKVKEKCGLQISNVKYFKDEYGGKVGHGENIAFNEGMTDFLAERITGIAHDGYNTEKGIYKVLALIIGQEILIKKAFQEEIKESQEPLNIFKDELISKYGEEAGNELNEELKRLSTLSDQLLSLDMNDKVYGLNENGKKIHSQTKEELYGILYSMIQKILSMEHDINKKIDMMIEFEEMYDYRDNNLSEIRKLIATNTLEQLLQDDSIDYTQKLEIIRKIKEQKINFQDEVIDEVLLDTERASVLSINEKLELYINLQKGERLSTDRFNRIYQMYVESGKIIENEFPKKRLVRIALQSSVIDSVEQINQGLNESSYYKLGEYYALPRGDNPINTVIFDKEGRRLDAEELLFNPIDDEKIDYDWDIKFLSSCFSEDKAKTIAEQIQEKFKQYKTEAKGECSDCGVAIIGDIIRLHYGDWNEIDETDYFYGGFYSVDENGNLELIPERRKTQNNR